MAVPDAEGVDPSAVRLEVTLPCDTRFRALRVSVVERLACSLGCTAAGAATRAVTLATSGVLDHPAGSVYSSVAITFTTGPGALTIRVRYLVDPGVRGSAPGPAVQRILSEGGGDAPLAAMRRLANRLEFGCVDGAECCTLVTPLPAAT